MSAMNSTVDQTIMNMCVWNPEVKRGDFINMFSWDIRDAQSVENTLVGIDKAIMQISDGYLDDDYETEEENYSRATKVISVLEDTREYFEHVIAYIESWTSNRFS
jgi:hypothetical protein